MIRVLVVDDHELIRASLVAMLGATGDIVVVGQCADGGDVLSAADALKPDVVIMDLVMPAVDGIEATRQLADRYPAIRTLILTGSVTGAAVCQALEAGAVGFLSKSGDPELLIASVRTVAAGGGAWDARAMEALRHHGGRRHDTPPGYRQPGEERRMAAGSA